MISATVSRFTRFQSTPPRGGRRFVRCGICERLWSFNPRPRAGGDYLRELLQEAREVSIHAPARGATKDLHDTVKAALFQSTPPRGGRHRGIRTWGSEGLFQSTPPRGGRPARVHHGSGRCCVSIHAPARGATAATDLTPSPSLVSIHAPARGATHRGAFPDALSLVSIHAPARGATASTSTCANAG